MFKKLKTRKARAKALLDSLDNKTLEMYANYFDGDIDTLKRNINIVLNSIRRLENANAIPRKKQLEIAYLKGNAQAFSYMLYCKLREERIK